MEDQPQIRTGAVGFRPDLTRLATSLPTYQDRFGWGQKQRDVVKRVTLGEYRPADDRGDPIARLLEKDKGRMPELLPIKYGRMAASPFGFFRGAVVLMAYDLAHLPATQLQVRICGDAHARNMGAFAAPDGHLVFDLNDFDEAYPGPWEWDLKRMATSILLAGREAGDRDDLCSDAVHQLVRSYRDALERFSHLKLRELIRFEIRRSSREAGPIASVLEKAERADIMHVLKKLTVPQGEFRRFVDKPPLLHHVEDRVVERVLASLPDYRETLGPDRKQVLDAYTPFDVTFKVVGTGSVGTQDYVVLLFGTGADDPLFLQIKEARTSPYQPYVKDVPPFPHEGRRVAEAQYRLQTVTDPFLGWTTIDGVHFIGRQLADHKAAIEIAELKGGALIDYASVAGEILAKGHARTGDAAALFGYCGDSDKLDKAIAQFAYAYASQTEKDHDLLLEAIRKGKVRAENPQ